MAHERTKVVTDFTASGQVIVPLNGDMLEFTFCGDGDVTTIDFTAGEGQVAASLTDQTGTFGSGTMTIEGTNLDHIDIGTTRALWEANTNGGYWETVTLGGTSSWTASFTNYIDAPFRFIRFRLASATNPRIKGAAYPVER